MGTTPTPTPARERDVFAAAVPSSMSMRQIRELVAACRVKPTKAAELDITKIPFGIEVEMENVNTDAAAREISGLPRWGWRLRYGRWKVEADQSLQSGGEAVSPVMRLGKGEAAAQVREVYRAMQANGGEATNRCGLHVHVDARSLGPSGLANLMKMALEQESMLFRLAQNGHRVHRGTINVVEGLPHYYARPLTWAFSDAHGVMHAESPDEFKDALYGAIPPNEKKRPALHGLFGFHPDRHDSARYFGINFNSYWYRGTIEFRFFDATDDPDQAMANVEMALGMVKAAAEDRYDYLQTHALSEAPVSREAFDYFLDRVAPTPQLRERLSDTFLAGGGRLTDDAAVTEPTVLQAASLLQKGYRFESAGKAIYSPFEIKEEIEKSRRRLEAVSPAGGRSALADKQALERLVSLP